jgi:hypothetical protein
MKRLLVTAALLQCLSLVAGAQDPSPPQWDDSLLVARVESEIARDSLAAGRLRWIRAGIVAYRLETHYECFCLPDPDNLNRRRNLLTIRNGRVVGRRVGKTVQSNGPRGISWTVDSLFSVIAEDLDEWPRRVRRMDLHPRYGFPMRYEADTPRIDDIWIKIVVDSFAVVRVAGRPSPPRSR